MKRIKVFIWTITIFFGGIIVSHAASLSMSTNKTTVVVGSTVTITVSASGAAGWEYCLNYDSSVFALSSTNSDTGGKCVFTGSTLIGYSKVTFTFKAIKSGSATFSLGDAAMYDDAGEVISSNKGSVTVRAKTQAEIEASYSTNANLSSLSVDGYELTPAFNKDTDSYTLEVENDIEKVIINATKADNSATISGTGEKSLTEGLNKFEIVVTAEKGNKKIYTIEITRKELNPIAVSVDGENMTVVRKAEALEVPTYYSITQIIINEEEVPALKSEITGFVLVGLKDESGSINLYIYDEVNMTYKIYKQVGMEGFVFIPIETNEVIKGYETIQEMEINGVKVNAYKNDKNDDVVLVYGMNAKSGESYWYKYDELEGTFQRFLQIEEKANNEESGLYFWIAIILALGLGVTILLLIFVLSINNKMRQKNNMLIEFIQSRKRYSKNNDSKVDSNEVTDDKHDEDSNNKVKKTQSKKKNSSKDKVIVDKNVDDKENLSVDDSNEEKALEHLSKRELRRIEKQNDSATKDNIELDNEEKKLDTDEDVTEGRSRKKNTKKKR